MKNLREILKMLDLRSFVRRQNCLVLGLGEVKEAIEYMSKKE